MNIGLYNRWLATLGGGEQYGLAIAEYLSREHDVTVLSHTPVDARLIGDRLGLDVRQLQFLEIAARPRAEMTALTAEYDLFINASHWDYFPSQAQRSAMVVFFPLAPLGVAGRLRYQLGRVLTAQHIAPLTRPAVARLAPALDARLSNLIPPNFLESVETYDLLWSISDFVQQWVQTYWQQESELLYPTVDVDAFQPGIKGPRILSVGRFFAGSHNKKHEVMIRAFQQMVDSGQHGWELLLVGGTRPEAIHQHYLDELRQMIAGYPISIHTDISRDELVRLYETSAIYWHAAGFGEDTEQAPHALEHFGITTVEAMAAGCVPVVFGSGGQIELVEPDQTGFMWYTTADLAGYTRRLMADADLRKQMADRAVKASHRFDQGHFEARLQTSLEKLGLSCAL